MFHFLYHELEFYVASCTCCKQAAKKQPFFLPFFFFLRQSISRCGFLLGQVTKMVIPLTSTYHNYMCE